MMGEQADLCTGDVIIRIPGNLVFSTVASDVNGGRHAWCRVEGKAPVDASVTLRFFFTGQQADVSICPDFPADLGGMKLSYDVRTDDARFSMCLNDATKPAIAYNEKHTWKPSLAELLSDPFTFLHPPPIGSPTEISAKVGDGEIG
jgi:hypothetical protein